MPKVATYELLVDGELIGPLLALWSARLDRIDNWSNRANRVDPLYDQLRNVYKAANQAHTDLTSLHIYQKRHEATSEKVQRQLQIATTSHQKASSLYAQLLSDMSD